MSTLLQLLYVSRAVPGADVATVNNILHASRRRNARDDVTGCLLFTGRHFAQVLEGRPAAVGAVFDRIAQDPRHSRTRMLAQTRSTHRTYSDWSMGYLYDLAVEDEIDRLCAGGDCDPAAVDMLIGRMRPDSMLGAL